MKTFINKNSFNETVLFFPQVEVNIPTAYMETDATRLDWTIQSRGIKIESMHDRIGVRSITKNVTGSSFTLSPVSILGLEYNGLALIPDQSPPGNSY